MKSSGFTLIELIISIVIISILGVFSFEFITNTMEAYISVSAEEDVAREARLSLERMVREVRASTNIVSPAAGVINATAITFDRNTTATDDATQVTFQVSGGTLYRQRVSGSGNSSDPLASNVSSFTVTRSSGIGELISLDLTLTGQSSIRQRTVVYPRYFEYP